MKAEVQITRPRSIGGKPWSSLNSTRDVAQELIPKATTDSWSKVRKWFYFVAAQDIQLYNLLRSGPPKPS